MIERTKGVAADKAYSKAQARMMGERKGKYRLFIPASAEDLRGLTLFSASLGKYSKTGWLKRAELMRSSEFLV